MQCSLKFKMEISSGIGTLPFLFLFWWMRFCKALLLLIMITTTKIKSGPVRLEREASVYFLGNFCLSLDGLMAFFSSRQHKEQAPLEELFLRAVAAL